MERADLGVPDGIAQMIEAQIEALAPGDRELLEVASVSGIEFAIPAVAGVMGCDTGTVETRCESLARARRLLRVAGSSEWPDGTVTRRYVFTHELYRQAVYAAVPDRQRMRLHQRLGEALETAYGERALEIAPALAVHFEKSRDRLRAVPYLTIAGARARQRFANREALAYLEAALAVVAQLPDAKIRQRLDANIEADAMATRLDTLANRVGTTEARLRADSVLVRIALATRRMHWLPSCVSSSKTRRRQANDTQPERHQWPRRGSA